MATKTSKKQAAMQEAPAPETTVDPNARPTPMIDGKLPDYLSGRRLEVGRVVSDKMQKTVVVQVERRKPHPIYKKVMRRSARFMAHDELGATVGDTVRIMECRPLSRHKRWQVIEIVRRGEHV